MTEFQPQNNKQAYLAYAVGLITDPALLPEPRTNEEALLREYCLSGGGGGGGIVLPTLTNPASGLELLEGYDAIDENGNVIYGDMEDNSRKRMQVQVDLENGIANVPRGFHDGITGVMLDIEEKTVTPSDTKQEIVPSGGAVLGKVIVEPAEGGGITISDASALFFDGARLDEKDKILSIVKDCVNMSSMFRGCSDLDEIDLKGFDTSKVQSMNSCFYGCNALYNPDFSGLDVSSVTDMGSLFYQCYNMEYVNLEGWDTRACTKMGSMFYGCSALTDPGVGGLNTSNVESLASCFFNCKSLESLDLSGWDTSKVSTMAKMFDSCIKLKSLNLNGWNTEACTSTANMFYGCSELVEPDVKDFDVSSVTIMQGMFQNCYKLKSVDMSKWDTSKVTTMSNMFSYCNCLEEILGFSAMNDASVTIGFPTAYLPSSPNMKLNRLTFRTNLPEGKYSIRSPIDIKGCSFTREDAVEMFNTLPDVSALGLSSSRAKITLTYNPCAYSNYYFKQSDYFLVDSYADFVALADEFYGTYNRSTAKIEVYTNDGEFEVIDVNGVTEENFNFSEVSFLKHSAAVPQSYKLTDEDRAIATSKGWTLAE